MRKLAITEGTGTLHDITKILAHDALLTDTSCLRHHHMLQSATIPSRLSPSIKIACEIFGSHSDGDEGSSLLGRQTLKMRSRRIFTTSKTVYQSARRYVPARRLQFHRVWRWNVAN